jgi:serine protease Do
MRSTGLALIASLLWAGAGQGQPPPPAPAPPAVNSLQTGPLGLRAGSFLGIGIQEITSDRAKALKLKEEAGVEITRVTPDSPADKAGLKAGDVVLSFQGTRVEGIEQMSRLVRETPVGREVKLDIIRNGAPQTVMARTGQHSLSSWIFPDGRPFSLPDVPRSILGWRSPMLGVEAEALEGQMAQYFGVKDGVLVRSVARGSAADKAGIKAGDVILKVDEMKAATPAEIGTRLRALAGKSGSAASITVPVLVMRDRKELTVMVAIDAAEPGSRPNSGRAEPVRIVSSDPE